MQNRRKAKRNTPVIPPGLEPGTFCGLTCLMLSKRATDCATEPMLGALILKISTHQVAGELHVLAHHQTALCSEVSTYLIYKSSLSVH